MSRRFVNNYAVNHNSYQTLTQNYSPKSHRFESVNGRRYIVAPMTMIVPGVLNGSQGRLFYPPDEIGKDPTPWNGMPITYYHPIKDGRNVSAREPGIIERQGIGEVRNARTGGKLRAEAWIDVERANRLDPSIVKSVQAGHPMEISTGLFTKNVPAENGAAYNGKPYTHVARNYRPDHLAILPNQRGACSIDDGCGLGANSNPEGHNQYTGHGGVSTGNNKKRAQEADSKMSFHHEEAGRYRRLKKSGDTSDHVAKMENYHSDMVVHYMDAGDAYRRGSKVGGEKHEKLATSLAGSVHNSLWLSYNRDWPQKKRDKLDRKDFAGPHQSFPIQTQDDVESAAKLIGHADDPEAVKSRIKAIAKRKGLAVPKEWDKTTDNSNPEGHNQWTGRATVHVHGDTFKAKGKLKDEGFTWDAGNKRWSKTFDKGVHPKLGEGLYHNGNYQGDLKSIHHMVKTYAKSDKVNVEIEHHPTTNALICSFHMTENVDGMSHEELRSKLHTAITSKMTKDEPDPYIREVHDDHVKYEHDGKMHKCKYKCDDEGNVKLSTKVQTLKPVTTWVEDESEPGMNRPDAIPMSNRIDNFNPNHGKDGRFASAHSSSQVAFALSSKATKSSKRANSSGSEKSHATAATHHEEARNAHKTAAAQHKSLANYHTEKGHLDKAKEHNKLAKEHRAKASEHKAALNSDGTSPSFSSPKGGNMAKLTANERSSIVDDLVSNEGCGCFNEEDREYLEGLSDNRLSEMQEKHEEHVQNAGTKKDDLEDEEGGEEDEEDNPRSKLKKKAAMNSERRMTVNEFRQFAPAEYLEAVDEAAAVVNEKKTELINKLTAHLKDKTIRVRLTANLQKQSLPALRDQLLLISDAPKAAPARPVYGPTGNKVGVTDEPVDNEMDDVEAMIPKRIDYSELSTNNFGNNKAFAHRN